MIDILFQRLSLQAVQITGSVGGQSADEDATFQIRCS